MIALSTVKIAVRALRRNTLRTLLTMLGIIFGVCSVIAMLAIGEGASYEAQQAIKKLGSQNIILRSVKPPEDVKQSGMGRGTALDYGLTYQDGARILATGALEGGVALLVRLQRHEESRGVGLHAGLFQNPRAISAYGPDAQGEFAGDFTHGFA